MPRTVKALVGAAVALMLASQIADAQVLFWSTQAKPVEETQRMRDNVLAGFEGGVDYQPSDDGPWLTRIQAELQAGTGTIGLLGGLHGSFASMPDDLVDLSGDRSRRRSGQRGLSRARQARHRRAEVPALDAGDLPHGRQQEGARVPAGGRRHQRAHLRPARRLVEGGGRGDRLAEVRLPGRPRGAEAPLLPGLPAALLRQVDGDEVPLPRGRGGLEQCSASSGSTPTPPRPATPSCSSRS